MIDKNFFKNNGPFSIAELESKLDKVQIIAPRGLIEADKASTMVHDISTLENASSNDITFFHNQKYIGQYKNTKALVCIVNEQTVDGAPDDCWLIVCANPYAIYAKIAQMFYSTSSDGVSVVSKTAIISSSAKIGSNCKIGDYVVIEDDVEIGDYSIIDSFTHIKFGVKIGKYAKIASHVCIQYTISGDNLFVLPGAKIGQDGFGFATKDGVHIKVPQLGRVIIGNDVEIGANTTIDRGSVGDTVIEDLVRIDNLVQIAHNVRIGKGSIMASQVGVSGSTNIGSYCAIGGQAGFAGHLNIGSYSMIMAQAGIMRDLEQKSSVGGSPAVNIRDWHRQTVKLNNLIKNQS